MPGTLIYSDQPKEELVVIKDYAARVPDNGIIVEIGTGLGGTAVALKLASNANVYTIDPYPYLQAVPLLTDLGITVLETLSKTAAFEWNHGEIDLLFVDGGHDFESFITDIDAWIPKLGKDAIVIFDDYDLPEKGGVANLAVKICLDSLLDSGMLTQVDYQSRLLITTANRSLLPSDIDVCYTHYDQMDINDDTERSRYQRVACTLPRSFWGSYVDLIGDKKLRHIFRTYAETYSMLQVFKKPNPEKSKIIRLSQIIALDQVELNILRTGLGIKEL